MIKIRLLFENFYALDGEKVRQFLLVEKDRALLIDTGYTYTHVMEAVRQLTDAPVDVVITHADPDHAGGLAEIGACRMNHNDWPLVQQENIVLTDLCEGDVVSCAGYRFRVIEIPGHTLGSVALYDEAHGLLMAGDSVMHDAPVFMFGGDYRSLDRYIDSLTRLAEMVPEDVQVLTFHDTCPISGRYIRANLKDAIALREGRLSSEPHPEKPCRIYHGESVDFLY